MESLPEHARRIEDARARARDQPARVERRDPAELPPFPDTALGRDAPEAPVGDHIPDSYHYTPSLKAEVWRDIWERDLELQISSHRGGLIGRAIVAAKRALARLFRAPLAHMFQRERLFNIALLHMVRSDLDEITRLVHRVRIPYEHLRDYAFPDVVTRTDAMYGIVDRRVELLEERVEKLRAELEDATARGLASPVSDVVSTEVPQRPSAPVVTSPQAPAPVAGQRALDRMYVAFEDLHRGTEREIGERQSIYLPIFANRKRVVDIGCGRGEMLSLLTEHGIGAYGVDVNSAMVQACRKRGLEVIVGDAVEHLSSLVDGSLDGVFSAQTFEHWEQDRIVAATRLIYAKLGDGAPFVMETQNPLSLQVGASSFWRDLTHVRPIHPDAFEFLVRAVGFRTHELRHLSPFGTEDRLPRVRILDGLDESTRLVAEDTNRALDALDSELHGHRDYAVIAWK